MTNLYHILNKKPAVDLIDMTYEYEDLAQKLLKSGRMRIDTGTTRNFIIFTDPSLKDSLIFSKKELNDESLVQKTKTTIQKLYAKRYPDNSTQIEAILEVLKKNATKEVDVNPEVEIKLARLFVQAAHPIVILWILLEGVEVFISYSHNIGDMMDIQNWQISGMNSGMQSTDGKYVAVFVSCGGDPFLPNNEKRPDYGDGWAAAARLQVIAGQELGHYADIMRDSNGRQIGRHSANFGGTRATEHVRTGRLQDIKRSREYEQLFIECGITNLITKENIIKLLLSNKVGGMRIFFEKLTYKILRAIFLHRVINKRKVEFVKLYKNEKYVGTILHGMTQDMLFNLAPKADVYKRSNKEEEEAIACIEALARVPQQVMKWGYITTQAFMQELYGVYYGQVIPSLVEAYERVTNIKFKRNANKIKFGIFEKIKLSKKENRTLFKEVRDIYN